MKISLTVTELWCVQECLKKINERGITWKLRKRKQSFLCMTRRRDQIHILIKLHEDIPNGYGVMLCTRILEKINQRSITWKLRKGEQSFLCATHRPDLENKNGGTIILVRNTSS